MVGWSEKMKKFSDVETIFLVIVFFTVSIFLVLFWIGYGKDFGIEVVATVLGVLLAFSMNAVYEENKKDDAKRTLLNDLHNELEYVKTRIYPQTTTNYIIYPDIWDSAKSSGDLRLLDSKQLIELTKIYYYIKSTSYYAERLRDIDEESINTSDASEEFEPFTKIEASRNDYYLALKERYRKMSGRHQRRMKQLDSRLDKVLKEKRWKQAKEE